MWITIYFSTTGSNQLAQMPSAEMSTATSAGIAPVRACPPPDVLHKIVLLLPSSDYPALRIASRDLAAAVDYTITSLTVTRWPSRSATVPTGWKRLHNVTSICVTTKPEWDYLQKLVTGTMPSLSRLSIPDKVNSRMPASCAAALTGLTRLDLGVNSANVPIIPLPKRGSVQLPALQAASFNTKGSKHDALGNGTLDDIAAFAPNLHQLYCQYFELQPKEAAVLPLCTHFGGREVHIVGCSSKTAGAAALSSAFPKLQTFSCIPNTVKLYAESKHFGKWYLSPCELLSVFKGARAIRGFGAQLARCFAVEQPAAAAAAASVAVAKRASQLQQLKALSIRTGMASSPSLVSVGQLRGLQHLDLVFAAPVSRHGPSPSFRATFLRDVLMIVDQLKQLSNLRSVALPAALLCSHCCNEGIAAAEAHSQLMQALLGYIPAAQAAGLQRLAFLDVSWLDFSSCYAEICWAKPEVHQKAIKARFHEWQKRVRSSHQQQGVVNVSENLGYHNGHGPDIQPQQGARDQQRQQPQPQQQQGSKGLFMELHFGLTCSEGPCMDSPKVQGTWGVYGPALW